MVEQDKKKTSGAQIDWGSISDLRHLPPAEVAPIHAIQGQFDFDRAAVARAYEDSPRRFISRHENESEILASWEKEAGVLLRAPWRSGKTETVLSLVDRFGLHDRFMYVTALTNPYPALQYDEIENFRRIFGAREAVAHVAAIRLRAGESCPPGAVETELEAFLDAGGTPFSFVGAERRMRGLPPALVALDEISVFGYDTEQLKYLASLRDDPQLRLCLIVQRAPTIEARYREALVGFNSVYLEPMRVGDVAQIVGATAARHDIRFSALALCEAHRLSGGRPLEVAALVETCVGFVAEGRLERFIDRDSLVRLGRGELGSLERTPLEPLIVNYLRVFERGLSEAEQTLVLAAIERPAGIECTEHNRTMGDELVRYGILVASNGLLRINGTLFAEAIKGRMGLYRTLNAWVPDEYGNDYPA